MLKLGLIKSGIQLVTGMGVGYIADNALAMVKPKNFTGIRKVAVNVGGFVLSAMAADKATDYIEKIWDDTANQIKDLARPKEEIIITEEVEAE